MKKKKKKCGIVMPISDTDGYPEGHWGDVLQIIKESIESIDFEPSMVSDDPAVGLIHTRIVTNLYNDDVIVCDVSSKNPNVMFELGMRLAFDKPVIIIKDENTKYSFDSSVIEHLTYPTSLRYDDIKKFKEDLVKKVEVTHKNFTDKPDENSFLKSFGKTIVPAKIENTEVPEGKYIREQLSLMTTKIQSVQRDIDSITSASRINYNNESITGIIGASVGNNNSIHPSSIIKSTNSK